MLGSWSGRKTDQKGQETMNVPKTNKTNGTAKTEDDDKALESLGRVLRCLGRHSFDLEERSEEEIEKEFERWAMHILVGVAIRDEDAEVEEGPIRRDWGELTNFVNRHRQQEKNYVNRNLQDVRNVLWEFTNTVGRAIVEDQETDQQVDTYLGQLRAATEGGSFKTPTDSLLGHHHATQGGHPRGVGDDPGHLEDLAREKVYEFCYIATTNKIKGTTAGFAMRPIALR